METSKLTGKQINGYAACNLSLSFANMLQMSYLTIFMTDYIGVPTATVATALLAARMIDFIFSLVSGMLMEKVRMPWGKYRSWLLVLRFVIIGSMISMFLNTSAMPMGVKAIVPVIGYALMNMSVGIQMNCTSSLAPLLAGDDMVGRTRLTARNMQFACVANIAFSLITLPLINALSPKFGDTNAFFIVAIIYIIPVFFGFQITSNVCRDCDPGGTRGTGSSAPSMSIKDMLRSIVENKQLLVLLLVFTLFQIGSNIIMNLGTYYYRYITGDLSNMTIVSTITMVVGAVCSFLIPGLARRIGKKKSMLIGLIIYGASIFANAFAGPNWKFYACFAAIASAGTYFYNTFAALYFIDAGEYYYWKTGKDSRLMSVAVYNISTKLSMILGGAIATYGLNIIGFNAGMEVSAKFESSFSVLLGIIPAILVAAAWLIMKFGYKITDANAAIYAKENAKKEQGSVSASN